MMVLAMEVNAQKDNQKRGFHLACDADMLRYEYSIPYNSQTQ